MRDAIVFTVSHTDKLNLVAAACFRLGCLCQLWTNLPKNVRRIRLSHSNKDQHSGTHDGSYYTSKVTLMVD